MEISFARCPICKEFGRSQGHRCPPTWYLLWAGDEGVHEEPVPVKAYTAREAVTKWITQFECDTAGEYGIATGHIEPVLLCFSLEHYESIICAHPENQPYEIKWELEEGTQFKVTGEYVPSYYVSEIKSGEGQSHG